MQNQLQRRDFLTAGAAAACLSSCLSSACNLMAADSSGSSASKKAVLRLGSQLRSWIPGNGTPDKLKQMKDWGLEAVEVNGDVANNPAEFKKMADDAGLKISVLCWGACNGEPCSADPEESKAGIEKIKKMLEAAAILECNGVIYVPAFNHHQERIKRTHQEIRKSLIDIDPNTKEVKGGFLKEVGDFAASLKTNIILEPLNRKEAWFLRQVADGAAICKDAQSEGVKTMADFYHMFYEEPSDRAAMIAGGKYLKHVHLGSGNKRILPGQDPSQSFVDGFRGLKDIGYNDFISFECGCLGGNEAGAVEAPKSLEYLKQCWAEA